MKLSEVKDIYRTMQGKTNDYYGTISKADIREFLKWLEQDKELKEIGYQMDGEQDFPFEFDWMLDEYIEQSYLAH